MKISIMTTRLVALLCLCACVHMAENCGENPLDEYMRMSKKTGENLLSYWSPINYKNNKVCVMVSLLDLNHVCDCETMTTTVIHKNLLLAKNTKFPSWS